MRERTDSIIDRELSKRASFDLSIADHFPAANDLFFEIYELLPSLQCLFKVVQSHI